MFLKSDQPSAFSSQLLESRILVLKAGLREAISRFALSLREIRMLMAES
jgi:hypothetical protein